MAIHANPQHHARLPASTDAPLSAESDAAGAPSLMSFEAVVFAGERAEAPQVLAARHRRPETCAEAARPRQIDAETQHFLSYVCSQRQLQLSHYRASVLSRRSGACLRAIRASSVETAWAALRRDEAQLDRIVDALLIGVTEFFRDVEVFLALAAELPGAAASSPGGVLRAASVGCSDGSELYSVAILLDDLGLLPAAGSQFSGTDFRSSAIASARAGVFTETALAGLSPEIRGRYFVPAGRGYRIIEPLRRACRWDVQDAFSGNGGEVDLLLCRNVAIYLEPEASQELWGKCIARVRPGGLLVVGKAERPSGEGSALVRRIGPCLYRKLGGGA
jgi:chemotaxis protein methyltransferase CheR